MRVALVILCRDQGRALEATLRQARGFAETVVVDRGSTEPYTLRVLATLTTPVLRVGPLGSAAATNEAIRRTASKAILVCDSDDQLPENACELLVARLGGSDLVGPAAHWSGRSEPTVPPAFDPVSALGDTFFPSCSLFRRERWEQVGGFDEALGDRWWEDFCLSAMGQGATGVVAPEVVIRRGHAPVSSAVGFERLVRKHQAMLEPLTVELLARRVEQHDREEARAARLASSRARLEAEIAALNRQCDAVGHEILALGHSPIDWGELRRRQPFSPVWGIDRGKPIDRVYIEGFLERQAADIHGVVLEVKDSAYTKRFGQDVERADAVDIEATNTAAQIHADLTDAWSIADATYDCVILTQTLHIIDDFRSALFHAHRILKPGGVLLSTLPALSRTNPEGQGLSGGDAWRFTEHSARTVFAEIFPPEACQVEPHGNVVAAIAFLEGLGAHELDAEELAYVDPWNPLLFCVRAEKPREKPMRLTPTRAGVVLALHRVAELSGESGKLCVSPELFRAQLDVIRRRYCPVALTDLIDGAIPEGAVALTFDDGYLDALTIAAPILEELGVPATFFVTTDALDQPQETWHDAVIRIFEPRRPSELRLGEHRFATATAQQRREACEQVQALGRKRSHQERMEILQNLRDWSGASVDPRATHRLLLGSEIRTLAANPKFTIGSHTANHLSLPAQPRDVVARELFESRETLTKLLGAAPRVVAYPYGEFDDQSTELARQAGYDAAVTVAPGLVRAKASRFTVPRLEIGRAAPAELERLLRESFGVG